MTGLHPLSLFLNLKEKFAFVEIDYKVTVNQALTVDQYPLPKPEELFATLGNGHKFTKLDLRQAYLQMETIRNN